MKGFWRFLLSLFCLSSSCFAVESPIVVLVPGYFNFPGVKAPFLNQRLQYFSSTILATLRAEGLTPVMIEDLDPVGTVAENGDRVKTHFRQIAKQHPSTKISVIAHSAGGLYTAKALTDQPDLPIQEVITIATPYKGAELADLIKWIPAQEEILNVLDLRSLREFQSDQIGAVTSQLRLPRKVRWVALGAEQEVCHLASCWHAYHMSWILSLAWSFMERRGDGVVSVESATHSVLPAQGGGLIQMENWQDVPIPLDHWKVVLEPALFKAVGVTDTDWIAGQQQAIFKQMARHLR